MNFEIYDGAVRIGFDMIATTALAILVLLLGRWIKSKVGFMQKYCIPSAVAGGFSFMIFAWIGHAAGLWFFTFNTALQNPLFMVAFFVTVGLGTNLSLLARGGLLLVVFWLTAGALSFMQNSLAIGLAPIVNIEYAYALLAAAIPMIGGHGTAAAYAADLYEMGYEVAQLAGASAATFGLIFSVMIGGPMARRLILKYNLKANPEDQKINEVDPNDTTAGQSLDLNGVFKFIAAVFVAMAVGERVAFLIGQLTGRTFPVFFGAMFVAVVIRAINGKKNRFFQYNHQFNESFGEVMLGIFLAMVLMTLRLWELFALAVPMLIILLAQTVMIVLFTYFILFRLLGKSYDAAVMCAGFIGFGMGATPTAVVNMTAVGEVYGHSKKALLIVPIVGGFLAGLIYHPVILMFITRFVG